MINTLDKLSRLNAILLENFGEIPDNIIVVSPDIMRQVKTHNQITQNTSLYNIKICDINVMNEVAEVLS